MTTPDTKKIDAAFDGDQLQTGDLTRPLVATTATAANSTTLATIEAKARTARIIIAVLSTLGTVALALTAFAPWTTIGGALALLAAVTYAAISNTLTPAQLDKLVAQLGDAGAKAASELSKKKDGTS